MLNLLAATLMGGAILTPRTIQGPPPIYTYLPTSSETGFSASISPTAGLNVLAGARYDETLTINDSDTFEKFFGSVDQGSVVKGNVSDLSISRVADPSFPTPGSVVFIGTSAVSDSSITYDYTIQASLPAGYSSPCDCADDYRTIDNTDPNPAYPAHLLKDSGQVLLSRAVTVRSS